MLTFLYVGSSILASVATLTHLVWTQLALYKSNFKPKRRHKLSRLIGRTYGMMLVVTAIVSISVSVLTDASDAVTAGRVLFNLLICFAHFLIARLTVHFIEAERALKQKSVSNIQ